MMRLCFLLAAILIATILQAQDNKSLGLDLGLEAQQYPTGYLLGLRAELELQEKQSLSLRLGYNGLDHQDFGVHESEIGGGFGGSIGYRYYFKAPRRGIYLGAGVDLWNNVIDWKDNIGASDEIVGESTILVLQPTAQIGYLFLLNNHWIITPTLAFGAEINIQTEGEPTGEGAILLWGLNLAYRL